MVLANFILFRHKEVTKKQALKIASALLKSEEVKKGWD